MMASFPVLIAVLALASALPVQAAGQVPGAPDTVVVQSGALTLRGLLWRPSGRGPFPAVLFNHGSGPAADPHKPAILGAAFARHGYVFLYLFRRGAGLSADQGTNSGELMARALAEKGQEGRNELQFQLLEIELSDVVAGLAFLRARPEVDARRVAVAGHAANDFSVAPGTALAAEMARLGKPHRLKIYPPIGQTPGEGHDFVHLGLSTWEPDVFVFLGERMRP